MCSAPARETIRNSNSSSSLEHQLPFAFLCNSSSPSWSICSNTRTQFPCPSESNTRINLRVATILEVLASVPTGRPQYIPELPSHSFPEILASLSNRGYRNGLLWMSVMVDKIYFMFRKGNESYDFLPRQTGQWREAGLDWRQS